MRSNIVLDRLQVLESMIEYGCDLDAKNFQDNTALHIMVARNRLSCVILLLSYGADVNAVGMEGDTPLHVAVKVAAPNDANWLPIFEQVSDEPGRSETIGRRPNRSRALVMCLAAPFSWRASGGLACRVRVGMSVRAGRACCCASDATPRRDARVSCESACASSASLKRV